IVDASLIYDDVSSGILILVKNLNHSLKGDLSQDHTSLNTTTSIGSLTVNSGGINYLKKSSLNVKAIIDADLKNKIYKFSKNKIELNQLILNIDGSVAVIGDDLSIILTFNAPQNTFKNFLSLVPAIYTRDFADIEAKGKLAIDGYVKGTYNDQTFPSYGMNVTVEDAMFRYPDLPSSVNDIKIKAKLVNEGGDIENVDIDISKFYFTILDNPVDIKLIVKDPVGDTYIDGQIKGVFDLGAIRQVYPLEKDEELKGRINVSVTVKGKLSSIEKEAYDEFTAIGSLLLRGFIYKLPDFNEEMQINNAQLNFSPSYLDLVGMDLKYGSSDLKASGKIRNYLAYMFNDKTLQGNLTTKSSHFNVNEFIVEETESVKDQKTDEQGDSVKLTVFKVPGNIDFILSSQFDQMIYDNIQMNNVTGTLLVRDESIILKNLKGNIFNGKMLVNGRYSTKETESPEVDLRLDISKLDIRKAYATFGIMQKFAPIARRTVGNLSTSMQFKTLLDQEMMPIWNSLTGNGTLNTSKITLENVNSMELLASTLKMDQFRKLDLGKVHLSFDISQGKIMVKPFDVVMNNMKANISGWTALDQSIEYNMKLQVPRKMFGGQANDVLNDLVNQANKQADNLIKEGKKKGMLAEIAARKTSEEVRKEGNKRANQIIAEADKQASDIMKKARQQAAKIREEAQKKVSDQ
ncbi:MAG: hypothetical protein IMY70_04500, partial [Bacteroidetes bacterium]|nr:hypothetical protein [Bacteroidota bacterium]